MHGLALVFGLSALACPQDPPEYAARRLQSVLQDLSEFARDIDSGARTLARAHAKEGQPDGMLTEVRSLASEHPGLGVAIQSFLRSKEEPLMGKALAVLALARPESNEGATLLGKFYSDPPEVLLVSVAVLGYSPHTEEKGKTWGGSLAILRCVKPERGWSSPQGGGAFRDHRQYFRPESPKEVDLRPMLEGMLEFLGRIESGAIKAAALHVALRISLRKEMTERLRSGFREAIERSYARRDEGWLVALQYLSGNLEGRETADLDALKKGFPGLDIPRQIDVLDHVARKAPASVFDSPFVDEFEKIIDYLAKPPKETGLQLGMAFNFIHAIRLRTRQDSDLKNRLMNHESSTLRQRMFLTD